MFWTDEHDVLLCREILVVDPFTGTKKKTVQRGAKWNQIAEILSQVPDPHFKVDQRAVRERYTLLAQKLRRKLKYEENASGIETDMSELETLLEEIIEKEDAAEESQEREQDGKKKEKENAQDMRNKAMERLTETRKRKSDSGEENRKKRRSNGNDTLNYLREKNEMLQESRKEEMELKKKQYELESKKHDDLMGFVLQQQQQQQRQAQEFQTMMMTLITKIMDK